MRRRTLDALLTTGGLIVATVLLVVGGLMTWASSFVATSAGSRQRKRLQSVSATPSPVRQ